MKQKFEVCDWGLIDYNKAWQRQKELVSQIQQKKRKSILVFCEHPSVITIGKSGTPDNIKAAKGLLDQAGIQIIRNDRGGDVTLHNPGQLVGYPIFNLTDFKQDLHWFLRQIENVIIDTVAHFGIESGRVDKLTGVWVEESRKICAMGLHCSRWVTSHGFALNVRNDLSEFAYIIPCGIQNKSVTSISKETGNDIKMNQVKKVCKESFENFF